MADVKLPPLPPRVPVDKHSPTGVAIYGYTHVMVRDYARACVAHATAAKDAELVELRSTIEALQRQVEILGSLLKENN